VAEHPSAATGESHALAGLICFQQARLPARSDPFGRLAG
jgi:hypothetical protein